MSARHSLRPVLFCVATTTFLLVATACGNGTPAQPTPSPGAETPFVSNARTWHKVSIPPEVQLLSAVACPSDSRCVAAGSTTEYRAVVIVTSDRGQTWTQATVPPNLMGVTELACPTRADCYAVTRMLAPPTNPYVLLRSEDGGATWNTSPLPTAVEGISCWGATSCLIVGGWEGSIAAFKTTDGGANWTASSLARTDATSLDSATCIDALHCWVVAGLQKSPHVFVTSDGGDTWVEVLRDYVGFDLGHVFCVGTTRCWSPASYRILATNDGGQSWTDQPVPYRILGLLSLACSSALDCIAVGHNDFLSTRDGGAHWGLESWPGGVSLNAVTCPSFCVAVGDTGVVVSER